MNKIKVMLADDHPLVRKGLRTLINSQPDLEVIGEAERSDQALCLIRELRPDVIVLDISLPDVNGLQLATTLQRENIPGKVVFLSMFNKESFIFRALDAGALGYVSKSAPSEEILVAIRWAYAGQIFLSPTSSTHIIAEYLKGRRTKLADSNYERLSQREQEVFKLVVEGHTNRSIAATLSISPKTVDKHRSSVMRKLEIDTLPDLVRYAISIGVLPAEEESLELEPSE